MVHGPWWILVGPPLQKHPTSEVPVHQADHAGVEALFQHLDPTGLSTATVLGSAVRFGCDLLLGSCRCVVGLGGERDSGSGTLGKEELLSILSGLGVSDQELPGSPCHVGMSADDHNPVPGCTCII